MHLRTLGTSSRRPFPPRTLGTSSRRSSRRPFPPRTLRISGKKRASQQRENHGQLRAPTQTAARAGRAVTLLARAVKNGVHSPFWWPFSRRTLRISGKKRASQQRESQVSCALQHKQLHALAVLSRCWPAQSKTACTHPYGGFSLLGLFVSLEKSEPVNGETATVSCTRRAAGAGRPARWPSCTLAVLHGQRARVTNHEDYED